MILAGSWRSRILAATACLWLASVCGGMGVLLQYASTAGDPGEPPPVWPADTTIPPPNRRPVLIMMAHPRCPCTRASLEELSRLMTGLQGRLDARVVFFAPADAGEEWWKSDLWEGAAAIPGVEVILDRDGAESQRFHTETSGHVLLYDTHGRLLFSGGITVARGHAGDNTGRGAIEELIDGETAVSRRTPVFGCALYNPATIAADTEGAWKC